MLSQRFFLALCVFAQSFLWIENGNALSVSEVCCQTYIDFCKVAALQEEQFSNFRRHPTIVGMIENAGFDKSFIKFIQEKYPFFSIHFKKICEEDRIGNPIQFDYPSIGLLSPTTVRYIKIAGDLHAEFKDLSTFRILEIGVGYGGQCKILSDLCGFASYTDIDLSNCLSLFSKYLNTHKVARTQCIPNTDLDKAAEYDLVISNYAFAEIDCEEQLRYLESVIAKIPRGYIIYNNPCRYGLTSLSIEQVVSFLAQAKRKIRVEPENPSTGEENCVIIWSPS